MNHLSVVAATTPPGALVCSSSRCCVESTSSVHAVIHAVHVAFHRGAAGSAAIPIRRIVPVPNVFELPCCHVAPYVGTTRCCAAVATLIERPPVVFRCRINHLWNRPCTEGTVPAEMNVGSRRLCKPPPACTPVLEGVRYMKLNSGIALSEQPVNVQSRLGDRSSAGQVAELPVAVFRLRPNPNQSQVCVGSV